MAARGTPDVATKAKARVPRDQNQLLTPISLDYVRNRIHLRALMMRQGDLSAKGLNVLYSGNALLFTADSTRFTKWLARDSTSRNL